jgi:hypothetical protein
MKSILPFSLKGGNNSVKIYTEQDIAENTMKGIRNTDHQEWTEWLGKFFHSEKNQKNYLNIKYIKGSEAK